MANTRKADSSEGGLRTPPIQPRDGEATPMAWCQREGRGCCSVKLGDWEAWGLPREGILEQSRVCQMKYTHTSCGDPQPGNTIRWDIQTSTHALIKTEVTAVGGAGAWEGTVRPGGGCEQLTFLFCCCDFS